MEKLSKCVYGCGQDGLYPSLKTGGMKCASHHNKCPVKKASLAKAVERQWANLTPEQKLENSSGLFEYRNDEAKHAEVLTKARLARIANGSYLDPDQQEEYISYRMKVRSATNQNYKKHIDTINPERLTRSRSLHVDHIYSIADGFINNVPVSVISHQSNLRMMDGKSNQQKNKNSDVTLEELYQRVGTDSRSTM